MKIYVAGHKGLVGSAVVRAIEVNDSHSWVGKTRDELDLLDRGAVFSFIQKEKPDWVVIAAAKVGGIRANALHPVEFLTQNLQIETNLLDACHAANISKVLFLGSSCIYPKLAPQPIKEEYLLSGPLEPTNEAYALAKIAGLKLVEAYKRQYGHDWISAMPTNLYGPGDNFDLDNSHVLPALIRKFHEAKKNKQMTVELWGSGEPLREFLHSDDLASACIHLLTTYSGNTALNIGSGAEISIKELSELVAEIVGFHGKVIWNTEMPDGAPRKLLDIGKINETGWYPVIPLHEGIRRVYKDCASEEWY